MPLVGTAALVGHCADQCVAQQSILQLPAPSATGIRQTFFQRISRRRHHAGQDDCTAWNPEDGLAPDDHPAVVRAHRCHLDYDRQVVAEAAVARHG